jgi:hypothetical protein
MNKPLLLFLFASIIATAHGRYSTCPFTTFVGTIAFPPAIARNPTLPAYYKGAQIDVHNGSYAIKEDMCSQEFFILFTLGTITPRSQTCEDCNTIGNLIMPQTTTYKCYKISHSLNPSFRFGSQKQLTWNIEVAKLKKSGACTVIPDNTIIILANPKFVDGLEQENWKSVNSTYRLPKIVFRENIGETAIADMANQAFLTSLDLNVFHRRPGVVKEIRQHKPDIVASIITG